MARSEWLGERERKGLPTRLPEVGGRAICLWMGAQRKEMETGTASPQPFGTHALGAHGAPQPVPSRRGRGGELTRWATLLMATWLTPMLVCAAGMAHAQGSVQAQAARQQSAEAVNNALPALPVSLWSRAGVPVTAVRFAGVTFGPKDAILAELKQRAGEPLDPEKVRADQRLLFKTGLYGNLSVDLVADGGGVAVVYAGSPRYFMGRVRIEGVKDGRLASLLEFATRLDPGAPFTEAELPEAVEAVKESLVENGYFTPKVALTTEVDNAARQVSVTLTIDIGPQARIGAVAVGGTDPGIGVAAFRKKGHLNCGWLTATFDKTFHRACIVKVTRNTVSNALDGVRSYYQEDHRLEGTISLQKSSFVAPREQVDYDFFANQGPVVEVVVNGVKLSRPRIKLLVPVYEEGAVDSDLLNEGAFNIKDYLQQSGYFHVTDKVKLIGNGTGHVIVRYTVNAGKKHKVTAVRVRGNKYFDRSTLEDLLRVKKADSYQRSGRYSAQLVSEDVDSIEALYQANGFSHVKVVPEVKEVDDGPHGKPLKEPEIQVTYTVDEGSQQRFGNVDLTGVATQRRKEVLALLNAQTGQPFSLVTLSGDRDAILSYYLAHGFEHAEVRIAEAVESGDKSRTDVALKVTEGQQVTVRQVLISGIGHTRPKVIEGQIKVHAGDPLDQSALLQTQRNLYNLALFSEVNAAVQDPTGSLPEKNVLVQLTEAKRWDVTYGFGIEAQSGTPGITTGAPHGTTTQDGNVGVSPRVSLDVARIDLRGTQESLTIHTEYGLLEEIATMSFNVPQLFGDWRLTGTISGGYSNVQNITTFASSTLQGDLRMMQKVKRADTLIYDFEYRRVSVNPNSLEVTPDLIPQLSEPAIVGGPQFTYIHDTRDPSPLNAYKGQFFSLQEFLATSRFGSESDFNKLDMSESTYYTFGKRKFVFARNLRVGFENSWGPNPNAYNPSSQIGVPPTACAGTLLELNATCNAVPLPERLYVGGPMSLRGFGLNDGGPRDLTTGYPVGGSGAVVNSFEMRFPPPTLPLVGDSIAFVLFHDMGNAFEYPGDMFKSIERFHQPDKTECRNLTGPLSAADGVAANAVGSCNFNYYSHAVGVGLRYGTPMGPIRLDFSYNLNPPIYPVFDDYTGAAPYVGQASHFNFFFSIGQSF